MKHFLEEWPEIKPILRDSFPVLFLDYDGTLTPIVNDPDLARLSPEGKQALENLAFLDDKLKLVIISGRQLDELKKIVGIPGIFYVGNHGFEIEGPSLHYVHPHANEGQKWMQEISKDLRVALRGFPEVLVENKIFTVSVHYRKLAAEKTDQARRIFLEVLRPHTGLSRVLLREGKKVWEIWPAIEWNKGAALLWLLNYAMEPLSGKTVSVYIGDDQTDEAAFNVMRDQGLSVKVMAPVEPTQARYYLRSCEEVLDFLRRLGELKTNHKKEESHACP